MIPYACRARRVPAEYCTIKDIDDCKLDKYLPGAAHWNSKNFLGSSQIQIHHMVRPTTAKVYTSIQVGIVLLLAHEMELVFGTKIF